MRSWNTQKVCLLANRPDIYVARRNLTHVLDLVRCSRKDGDNKERAQSYFLGDKSLFRTSSPRDCCTNPIHSENFMTIYSKAPFSEMGKDNLLVFDKYRLEIFSVLMPTVKGLLSKIWWWRVRSAVHEQFNFLQEFNPECARSQHARPIQIRVCFCVTLAISFFFFTKVETFLTNLSQTVTLYIFLVHRLLQMTRWTFNQHSPTNRDCSRRNNQHNIVLQNPVFTNVFTCRGKVLEPIHWSFSKRKMDQTRLTHKDMVVNNFLPFCQDCDLIAFSSLLPWNPHCSTKRWEVTPNTQHTKRVRNVECSTNNPLPHSPRKETLPSWPQNRYGNTKKTGGGKRHSRRHRF